MHLAAILVLWPVFTGSVARDELLVGVVVLLLTLAFLRLLEHCMPVRVRFRLREIVQVWRLPGEMLRDVAQLTGLLMRSLVHGEVPRSRYRLLRWGGDVSSAEARGREVLLVTYLSATPNSIVLGVDRDESLVVLHETVPAAASGTARALGAQP